MDDKEKKYPQELFNRPISTSSNPNIINQLQAFIEKVRAGYPGVEVQTFRFEEQWARIPKMIFEEIARSAKINNIELSIHAPENDFQISGIKDVRQPINEEAKKDAAYKISSVLEGGELMGQIYGKPIKVNMHGGDIPLTQWDKEFEERVKNKLLNDPNYRRQFAEKLYRLGFITQDQYNQLIQNNINRDILEKNVPSWAFARSEAIYYKINGNYEFEGLLSPYERGFQRVLRETGRETEGEIRTIVDDLYDRNEKFWIDVFNNIDKQFSELLYKYRRNLNNFVQNLYTTAGFASVYQKGIGEFIFDIKTYRNVLEEVKRYIDIIKENIGDIKDQRLREESLNNINKYEGLLNSIIDGLKNYENRLSEYAKDAMLNTNSEQIRDYLLNEVDNIAKYIESSSDIVKLLMYNMKTSIFADKIIPVAYPFQEVATKVGAENIAEGVKMLIEREKARDPENWYKNIAQYLPDIIIEESYPGTPGTRPDIWKNLLNNIREELRETINQYPELKKEIEKQYGSVDNYLKYKVGANLDVGHIKMFEKFGYNKEDILKWVEEIKPEIKHLHLHEAQWGTDTHLPVGLGWDNVIAEELEKIKDILGNISVVHEPGGWYSYQFAESYGNEYSYYLQGVNPTNVYGPLYGTGVFTFTPYGGVQLVPQYIQYTQYSPYSYSIFTQLPLDLGGGKKQQTFTGEKLD
ncbi:hypothetical protein YN1_2300 [Nanoarchaeota archaeon]